MSFTKGYKRPSMKSGKAAADAINALGICNLSATFSLCSGSGKDWIVTVTGENAHDMDEADKVVMLEILEK